MVTRLYHCPDGHQQEETITLARFPAGTPVAIVCQACGAPMDYFPEGARVSLMSEDFVVDVGDGPLRLRSISEIRAFERASQQRYANGEGAPYNLRAFSQDSSNRDVNTFGRDPRTPFKPMRGGAMRPADAD